VIGAGQGFEKGHDQVGLLVGKRRVELRESHLA
jgi:hypothetical protein